MSFHLRPMVAAGVLFIAAAASAQNPSTTPVTQADLVGAPGNSNSWLMYGRTYSNWRHSGLDAISTSNVDQLKPVWAISTGGNFQGLEATPLFHDGTLYFSADGARVFAVNARTGKIIWEYSREYPPQLGTTLCCGPVNRGVALKDNLVYVATLDAHMVALDAATGKVAWDTQIDDWKKGATETGAPLVVGNHVIIGISGGEYGVRAYLKAYDARTGALQWTTYVVPGPGKTWENDAWKHGGGPTWVPGAYDAETNTLYWGVGNPGPWFSPTDKGKKLWSDSLLAMNPDTGKIKWGFQYTPNDEWDYDGMSAPILTDAVVNGKNRKVAVQANRNGFLYVLDRTNGKFLYAEPMIPGINWTFGLDPKTGEPKVNDAKRPSAPGTTTSLIIPGLEGGTNWFQPSYDPKLHYVFVNVNDWGMTLTTLGKKEIDAGYKPGEIYQNENFQMYRLGKYVGHTKAFDLKTGKFVWDQPSTLPIFSHVLSTAGGLVFTGDTEGNLIAMDSRDGRILWKFQTGSAINAGPITYELDGVQYVAVLSGIAGDLATYYSSPHGGMLWVFAINGKQQPSDATNSKVIDSMLPLWKGSTE